MGLWSASATLAFATFAEFLPVLPKTIAGTLLAGVNAFATFWTWIANKRRRGQENED